MDDLTNPETGRPSPTLLSRFRAIRRQSELLAAPLGAEDQCVQSMPDASPSKWHLAHTTWFFESLVLQPHAGGYQPFDERFFYLFNSYYEALGPRHPRPARGLLTRPGLAEVQAYRRHVDAAMATLLERSGDDLPPAALAILELGLHHEQQHQELLLTDIKHLLSCNPLLPAYRTPAPDRAGGSAPPLRWPGFAGGVREIGHAGTGFAFDNETPRHVALLHPYRLASRPVNCGEYLQFMEDGGYAKPLLWLSDGWAAAVAQGWRAPLYWRQDEAGDWHRFTLNGERPVEPDAPVTHVSLYEAAAFAEWAGRRLPTEFEWEAAAAEAGAAAGAGRPFDPLSPEPRPAGDTDGLQQLHGEVWQWTRSAYDPYPGFRPLAGPAAEYNGKFMVGQVVLRGSSCATPDGHARTTYRNFFPPHARWQFSGIRLAEDA